MPAPLAVPPVDNVRLDSPTVFATEPLPTIELTNHKGFVSYSKSELKNVLGALVLVRPKESWTAEGYCNCQGNLGGTIVFSFMPTGVSILQREVLCIAFNTFSTWAL